MKKIKPFDIFRIASPGLSTCVSIYINDPSNIKTTLAEARRIASKDFEIEIVNSLLDPIEYLAKSKKWLKSQSPTGIFVTKGFAGFMNIPFDIKDLVVVADSFHVKPLIKWMQIEKPFYLLHFGSYQARLFQGELSGLKELEAIEYKKAKSKDTSIAYLERGISTLISHSHMPLILSGDPSDTETFKNLSPYKWVLSDSINGVEAEKEISVLHKKALQILKPFLEHQEQVQIQKYWAAKLKNQVSANLDEIIRLALKGEIKHLFINEKMNIWGQINYRSGQFVYHAKQIDAHDDDVLDDLAEIVMYHHGQVTVLPTHRMPDSQSAAAILRTSKRIPIDTNLRSKERQGTYEVRANIA